MNRIILSLLLIGFIVGTRTNDVNAQCKQQIVYSCATDNGKAIFLRDFNTKLKKSKSRPSGTVWSQALNKDTHYRFNLCTQNGYEDRVVLTLFDSKHPESQPYVVTKSTNDPKTNNRFDFICPVTGTYYISIRFRKGVSARRTCAVGVISMVGKRKRK